MLDAIARTAARLCEAHDALIYQVEGDSLRLAAKHGRLRAVRSVGDTVPLTADWVGVRAVLTGKTIHVRDLRHATTLAGSRASARITGARTLLVTPLLRNGSALGSIVIRRTTVRPFTAKQIALLKTFADQAAIAIENARLAAELEARNRQLGEALGQQTATAEILRAISTSPTDVQPVFAAVTASAARLCDAVDATIFQVDGPALRVLAHEGPIRAHAVGGGPPMVRGTPPGRAVLDGETVHVVDVVAEEDEYPEGAEQARRFGHRTVLVVPLLQAGLAIGAIAVRRTEVRPFTDRQVELLRTFADQAVIAIENVRLFDGLQASNRELRVALEQQTATSELLKVIGRSTFDLQPVFETLAENAVRLCEAERGFVYRFDGRLLRLVVAHNASPQLTAFIREHPFPPGRGNSAARAALEGRVNQVADAQTDPAYDYGSLTIDPIRTVMSIPMLRAGELLGVITLYRLEVRPFTDSQTALLEIFADQAAIAIENARLLSELQASNTDLTEALQQQTATADILRVISTSPTNLQPVLDAVVRSAARFCGAPDASVFRLDGDALRGDAHHGPVSQPAGFLVPVVRGSVAGRSVLERRAVDVADLQIETQEFPEGSALARQTGQRATLSVPLLREGVPIGAILLRRAEAVPFTDKHIALLETFADQAVIAIENVRLFEELQEKNAALTRAHAQVTEALERQTATSDILRVISGSPTDTRPVFDVILDNALRLCDAERGIAYTYDGEWFVGAVARGLSAEAETEFVTRRVRPSPMSGIGRMLAARRPVQIADVTDDVAYRLGDPLRARTVNLLGARTAMWLPLLKGDAALGALAIYRCEVRPFTDQQIALVQTFADQAVIAIENVRLFKELEARNRDLTEALDQQTATAEILRAISSSPNDVRPVFDAILANAARLCDAHRGALLLLKDGALETAAELGAPAELSAIRRTPYRPERDSLSLLSRVFFERRALYKADLVNDSAYAAREPRAVAAVEAGSRSMLAVPLLKDEALIGIITIHRPEPGPFSNEHIALLGTFADQAVIAIENVRLFKELEARNRELGVALDQQTATADILRVISRSPTDVQPVFQAIVDSAARLLRGNSGVLSRIVGDQIELGAFTRTDDAADALLASLFPISLQPSASEVRPIRDRVIGERIPYNVADVETDPRVGERGRANARARGYRSQLVVPMLRHDEPLGTIAVTRPEPGAFSDEEIALLTTFADQAVIAIENVRLFKELQARNRDLTESLEQQTATSEILRVISSSPTQIQPVLDALAESAARLCRSVDCNIFLVDGDRLALRARYGDSRGEVVGEFAIPIVRGTVGGRTVIERRAVHVADLQAEGDQFPQAQDNARKFGFRTMLSVPLIREGAALGVIQLRRTEVSPFTDRQVDLLTTFADQAVIAIENVRLFKELESRNRELTASLEQQTATSEILRVISSSPGDIQPVFDAIAANAARLCDAVNGLVIRFDGQLLHLAAHYNVDPARLAAVKQAYPRPPSRGALSGRAILTRAVVHVPDVSKDPEYSLPLATTIGYASVLAVPMMHEGVPRGAILVARDVVAPFSDAHIALIQTFADQAVIAIENVRLFTELQARTAQLTRSVGELTALGDVGRALSSTLDLEAVLNMIVSRAVQLSGLDGGVVFEYDPEAEEFVQRAATETGGALAEARRATRVHKGEGVVGRTAVTLEPAQVPDITVPDAYASRLRGNLIQSGIRGLLAVPMVSDGRLVGCLVVSRNRPGDFPADTIELLQTFATQSAVAIQNARLFREIEDKSRQLEVASRHKSQFLANMSHELRTPLNAILGYTELIADNIYGEVPERMREVLERVDKSGRHLLGLINDILDLSKIEAGQLTLALGPYSMDGVAQTVATQVGALASEKQLGFEVVLADDLPIGQGDERRLTQVLLNLVGNAIKFTDVGKVVVRVGTSGDAYVVSVTDTGPGIAEADREKIFEEFQQADTTRAKAKGGTGLGLAISRRIVEMHGGRLEVESTPGEGSTFSFTVPVHVEYQVAPPRPGGRA